MTIWATFVTLWRYVYRLPCYLVWAKLFHGVSLSLIADWLNETSASLHGSGGGLLVTAIKTPDFSCGRGRRLPSVFRRCEMDRERRGPEPDARSVHPGRHRCVRETV